MPYDTAAISVITTTHDHSVSYRLLTAAIAIRLPMPVPVANHSATVAASTVAGTAMRAAAKNAGSIAGT